MRVGAFFALAFFTSLGACASEVVIDATVAPKAQEPLAFAVGGKTPDGHTLSANTRYLTRDGQPWFPVMGEFHFSRYPAAEWETELLKMSSSTGPWRNSASAALASFFSSSCLPISL